MRTWVIAVLALGACSKPSAPPPAPPPAPAPPIAAAAPIDAMDPELALPNRALTSGEVALLKPLFRDGIDYARVRVIDNSFPLQPENVYMTPRGHIYAPGSLFRADFSLASSGQREVFVHEMTHVWQFENGMDLIGAGTVEFIKNRGSYEKAYAYELATARDLVEYGMEQQASIVEDFFSITVDRGEPHRMTNRAVSGAERDALYAAVLKNFFANARYARGLDPKQVAAQHARDSELSQPGPEACKESEQEHGSAHMCSWRYQPLR